MNDKPGSSYPYIEKMLYDLERGELMKYPLYEGTLAIVEILRYQNREINMLRKMVADLYTRREAELRKSQD